MALPFYNQIKSHVNEITRTETQNFNSIINDNVSNKSVLDAYAINYIA